MKDSPSLGNIMKFMIRFLPALLCFALLQGCASGLIVAAGTAVAVNSDERTLSQQIEDDRLSLVAIDKVVNSDVYNKNMRINIVTNNSFILLIGQADSQANSNKIEDILINIDGIKGVYNQLRIGQTIGLVRQTQDTWLTTKVKSKLTGHDKVDPLKIKVVTENAEVFLIGQVTKEMSDFATSITSNVEGVKQVIRVFEMIPEKQ